MTPGAGDEFGRPEGRKRRLKEGYPWTAVVFYSFSPAPHRLPHLRLSASICGSHSLASDHGEHLARKRVAHHDAFMRTTVTLDKDVERKLREAMHESRASFKQVLNSALRAGLNQKVTRSASRPFVVQARPLGLRPRPDPTAFNKLTDDLEVEALVETNPTGDAR